MNQDMHVSIHIIGSYENDSAAESFFEAAGQESHFRRSDLTILVRHTSAGTPQDLSAAIVSLVALYLSVLVTIAVGEKTSEREFTVTRMTTVVRGHCSYDSWVSISIMCRCWQI
jgi:hypothetical protein